MQIITIILFSILIITISAPSSATENPDIKLVAQAELNCSAQWNELCEDKKIISVPENYHLCRHELTPIKSEGDTEFSVTDQDTTTITVYFRASGNNDRFKKMGAAINVKASLYGLRINKPCQLEEKTGGSAQAENQPVKIPAPTSQHKPSTLDTATKPHACACSQWQAWIDVSNCLTVGENKDGSGCDTLKTTLQCVDSQVACRTINNDQCPQIVSIDKSNSYKRIFIENSPYCLSTK